MCGLVGSVGIKKESPGFLPSISLLQHRGPDDERSRWIGQDVFLGHTRLRVIDLSEAGSQPMATADGMVWIVYNGEIYNYLDLREVLSRRGHRFRSRTDTEVILHLYEEKGESCFQELNGMFAIALYDVKLGRLFLVRDRLGIKPLYYFSKGNRFLFASEIKAILASGLYTAEMDQQALHDYFTYLFIPSPRTIFRGIWQVPPAHFLMLDGNCRKMVLKKYWYLERGGSSGKRNCGKKEFEAEKEELRDLLTDSVRRRLISDVPLGIFLSGGVDSPILTGIMASLSNRPVKTFTLFFQGRNFDAYNENNRARLIANHYGTDHTEIGVELNRPEEMLKLVRFFDQPFGNPTFYLMHMISELARAEMTVALCGAGGDELFAGYPRYRAGSLARWFPGKSFWFWPAVGGLLRNFPSSDRRGGLGRFRRFLEGLDGDPVRQYIKWTYFFGEEEKKLLFQHREGNSAEQFGTPERILRRFSNGKDFNDLNNLLYLDIQTFLPDNVLEYSDKMSMAVGLEVRLPFLDHRLVEQSFRIPFQHKLRLNNSKIVLKEAFNDFLLPELLKAPKRGFNLPISAWMREELDRYFERFMGKEETRRQGILNWEFIQILRGEHRSGRQDRSYELFSILMFDLWYRKYLLGDDRIDFH